VFVSRSSQPSLLHAHLPLLTVTASLSHPEKPPIVLVTLPKGAESRLVSALGVPRVGVVGLSEGAPGSKVLVEFVREKVKAVDAEWLGGRIKWRGTEIRALKTTAGGGKSDKDAGKGDRDRAGRTTKTKHKNRAGEIGNSER
jgi:ribonuclease P/MRP protein subunit POP3